MRFVFFLLAPFFTFLRSCWDLRHRSAQIIFVLFFGLFGYCHTFEDSRADSYRKKESFSNYGTETYSDIFSDYHNGEIKDIYEGLLYTTLKQFTDDPHILMMMVGLFAGFFYMLVVKRFLQDNKMGLTWPVIILLSFVVMESNIPIMGNIRSFTAFPLLMYSIMRLLLDNKKIWIIGLLVTPLIHFGYMIVVVAALVIWLIKIPNVVMHYVAIVVCASSLFLSTSSYADVLGVVVDSMENESIADRIDSYGDEDVNLQFNKSLTTRLVRVNNQIGTLFMIVFLMYIYHNRKRLINTPYIEKIYHLLLFFTIIGYTLISFSVVGQRFVYIAMVLLYLFLLNLYQQNPNSHIKKFIYSLPVVFSIHILWFLYNCYCNTGWGIYYKPLLFLFM